MAYTDDDLTYLNTGLRNRVRQALGNAAFTVANEIPSGNTDVDTKRKALANLIINNTDGYVARFTLLIVSKVPGAITTSSPDTDIRTAVDAVFSTVAGV